MPGPNFLLETLAPVQDANANAAMSGVDAANRAIEAGKMRVHQAGENAKAQEAARVRQQLQQLFQAAQAAKQRQASQQSQMYGTAVEGAQRLGVDPGRSLAGTPYEGDTLKLARQADARKGVMLEDRVRQFQPTIVSESFDDMGGPLSPAGMQRATQERVARDAARESGVMAPNLDLLAPLVPTQFAEPPKPTRDYAAELTERVRHNKAMEGTAAAKLKWLKDNPRPGPPDPLYERAWNNAFDEMHASHKDIGEKIRKQLSENDDAIKADVQITQFMARGDKEAAEKRRDQLRHEGAERIAKENGIQFTASTKDTKTVKGWWSDTTTEVFKPGDALAKLQGRAGAKPDFAAIGAEAQRIAQEAVRGRPASAGQQAPNGGPSFSGTLSLPIPAGQDPVAYTQRAMDLIKKITPRDKSTEAADVLQKAEKAMGQVYGAGWERSLQPQERDDALNMFIGQYSAE